MRSKVLIVDDVEINREILYEILKDDYEIIQADGGRAALEMLKNYNDEIAVVILDLIMPDIDGFGVLEEMKKENLQSRIPVLVISGESHIEAEEKCFDYGVCDFIHKPYYANVVKKRIVNLIELFQYRNNLEDKVARQTVKLRNKNQILQQQAEKLKNINEEIIEVLGTIVESRNLESGEHVKRVKGFSRILANCMMNNYPEYGLTPEIVEMISAASALHDIGKIAIPDNILLKPGKLTKEEFEQMKLHSVKGYDILQNMSGIWDEDYNRLSCEICRYHHERYDGRGYPDGLKGDEIPISAQIVSLADVYDALVRDRVYKKAFSKQKAYEMITAGECGVFSPKLMDCFEKSKAEFEKLADSQNL